MDHELALAGQSGPAFATSLLGNAEWLSPQAALERFVPPAEILWSGAQEVVERKRYGYRIGSLHFLIAGSVGSEVLRRPAISSLPGSASWLLGMMNLRGNLVPVFDLADLLGVHAEAGTQYGDSPMAQFVLVLDKGEHAVGIVIDGFPQALTGLAPILRMPQLPRQLQAHVQAAFFKDDNIWLDFQHQSFFEQMSAEQGVS